MDLQSVFASAMVTLKFASYCLIPQATLLLQDIFHLLYLLLIPWDICMPNSFAHFKSFVQMSPFQWVLLWLHYLKLQTFPTPIPLFCSVFLCSIYYLLIYYVICLFCCLSWYTKTDCSKEGKGFHLTCLFFYSQGLY